MECSPMESISIEHISMWHDLRHPNQARWMAKVRFARRCASRADPSATLRQLRLPYTIPTQVLAGK